jgi:hypothetical protein
MAGTIVTVVGNGIMFDRSAVSGAGTSSAKYVFRPLMAHTFLQVTVQNDYMSYITAEGKEWTFSWDGANGSEISSVAGVATSSNYDLFTKFIALL